MSENKLSQEEYQKIQDQLESMSVEDVTNEMLTLLEEINAELDKVPEEERGDEPKEEVQKLINRFYAVTWVVYALMDMDEDDMDMDDLEDFEVN